MNPQNKKPSPENNSQDEFIIGDYIVKNGLKYMFINRYHVDSIAIEEGQKLADTLNKALVISVCRFIVHKENDLFILFFHVR